MQSPFSSYNKNNFALYKFEGERLERAFYERMSFFQSSSQKAHLYIAFVLINLCAFYLDTYAGNK